MSNKAVVLEDFLAHATAILATVEDQLATLAQTALISAEQGPVSQGNGTTAEISQESRRLQQVSQYLLSLSEQIKFLHRQLGSDIDTTLLANNYWPQIKILQSQEEERAQVAHELEDSVGQLLANAIFELASVRQLLAGQQESVTDGLDALQEELEQGLTDIRQIITNLEPTTILSNFGLGGGIRRYLEQYQARTGIETQVRMKANIGRLPGIVETAIFRVIQEALNNVYLHANASQVDVVVEEKGTCLLFSIIDNGDGMNSEKIGAAKRNLGLARMVDYAELLNGKLRILSEPGQGTQVILLVSYPIL